MGNIIASTSHPFPLPARAGREHFGIVNLRGGLARQIQLPAGVARNFRAGTVFKLSAIAAGETGDVLVKHIKGREYEISYPEGTPPEKILEAIDRLGKRNLLAAKVAIRSFGHDLGNKCLFVKFAGLVKNQKKFQDSFEQAENYVRRGLREVMVLANRLPLEYIAPLFREIIADAILHFMAAISSVAPPPYDKEWQESTQTFINWLGQQIEMVDRGISLEIKSWDLIERLDYVCRICVQSSSGAIDRPPSPESKVMANNLFLIILLENLLNNAVRAISSEHEIRGRISVAIKRDRIWTELTISNPVYDPKGKEILPSRLVCELDPRDGARKQRLFFDGQSSKPEAAGKSHGQGLGICYDIVRAFGGDISASYNSETNVFTMKVRLLSA